jgi:hypothetical protein
MLKIMLPPLILSFIAEGLGKLIISGEIMNGKISISLNFCAGLWTKNLTGLQELQKT